MNRRTTKIERSPVNKECLLTLLLCLIFYSFVALTIDDDTSSMLIDRLVVDVISAILVLNFSTKLKIVLRVFKRPSNDVGVSMLILKLQEERLYTPLVPVISCN